jgi:hypothetical protein
MKPAKHKRCNTEITIRRSEGHAHLWCPTCKTVVFESEVTVKGPYCVTTST